MRGLAISPRDRRALSLGALVLVPVAAWIWGVAPYLRGIEAARERLAAERELLVREMDLVKQAHGFPAAWEEGSERLLEAAPRLFTGANPAVASAALARYLQAGAKSSKVLLTQVEPAPSEDVGAGVISLPLRVEGETDLEGIMSLLYNIEAGLKLVRVDGLHVQGLRTGGGAVGPDEPTVLRFSFTATGFALADVQDTTVRAAGSEEDGP
jgi:hypothetical protein